MKSTPAPTAAKALQKIPNVGPAIAADLLRLGITRADDLVDRERKARDGRTR
jgi:predicted flap endonuclease-1-like 5' DNA nuclease